MTVSVVFFLSPQGHLVRVPVNHISTVIADPERFGLTQAADAGQAEHEPYLSQSDTGRIPILAEMGLGGLT